MPMKIEVEFKPRLPLADSAVLGYATKRTHRYAVPAAGEAGCQRSPQTSATGLEQGPAHCRAAAPEDVWRRCRWSWLRQP